jgi:uncharacterized protein
MPPLASLPVATGFLLVNKDRPADEMGNLAPTSMVANPDNLKFFEMLRTLFIGEDSSQHVNNYLWSYNVNTKELALLQSTPAETESTGLHAVDELNGWTYIVSNFQHAGDWQKSLHGRSRCNSIHSFARSTRTAMRPRSVF